MTESCDQTHADVFSTVVINLFAQVSKPNPDLRLC